VNQPYPPLIGILLWICLGASWAFAQASSGAFRGVVRDATGAALPNAEVRIESLDAGRATLAFANGQGLYASPDLVPGTYQLTASRAGFRAEVMGPVKLLVNQTVRVDFSLSAGRVTESVRVEATSAQLLASESAEISQVITHEQVSEIPLNGRRWQQLIALSTGVNPGSPGETGSPHAVNINGQRTKANLYLVDGVSTTSSAQGRGNGFNIPLEAVQEFSVQAGSYSAEYGNVAGGVVNLQSKSGTNLWHGSAFEYFRHDRLDAANFFSNATGQARNALRYNQFGGAISGPLRRDRTFVFADQQGTVTRAAAPQVTTVRPDAQRRGDFSALRDTRGQLIPLYDPFAPTAARNPFPGNIIPASRLDPAARRISALLPQPNQFDANGAVRPFNNYAVTRAAESGFNAFDFRIDHQFSERNSLFWRYSFQGTQARAPSLFGSPLGGTLSGAGTTDAGTHNAALGHTYQVTPTLIHDFRVGVLRQTTALKQEDFGRKISEEFGIPGVNRSDDTSGLATISVAGVFNAGASILTPLRLATTAWNWSDKLLWIRGRHAVRLGGDGQSEMGSSGYRVFGRGYYTFLNLSTSTAVGPPGGDAFASFLTGAPFQILRDDFPPGMVALSSTRAGFYLQDDFKVTSRLTLNLGARFDILPYAQEQYDRLSNFDPATRTMLLAGRTTSRRLRDTDYRNLAPRVGLAFAPGKSMAIRAGYGIGYIDPAGAAGVLNSPQFNIPFYYRDNITQFPFLAPRYTLSSLLPSLAVPSPAAPTGDQRFLVPGDRNQYSQTWSLSVQHAWNPNLLLEAAYVGSSGNRLLMTSNLNAAPPGATDPVARRPFGPALADVRAFSNSAHSVYHGFQTRLEQRFTRGVHFRATYTWSKSIDNQSTGTDDAAAGGQSPQNPRDHSLERGPSTFDRAHRFTSSLVWALPRIRGAKAWDTAIGGWQLSGIVEAQTGAPFSVLMPCAAIGAEGNNCRPNALRPAQLEGEHRSIHRWFDATAFAIPSPQAYGNAGRNLLRGPGSANLDAAVSKSFALGHSDSRRIRLRGEFFNALNHANFGLPIHTTDSPAIGTINSASPGRVVQLSLRVEF
jgi:hypothetical protein